MLREESGGALQERHRGVDPQVSHQRPPEHIQQQEAMEQPDRQGHLSGGRPASLCVQWSLGCGRPFRWDTEADRAGRFLHLSPCFARKRMTLGRSLKLSSHLSI